MITAKEIDALTLPDLVMKLREASLDREYNRIEDAILARLDKQEKTIRKIVEQLADVGEIEIEMP